LTTVSKPLIETTAEKMALRDTAAHAVPHRRELARRLSGGIEVTLYWSPDDNTTSVEISQPQPKKRCSSTSHASVHSTPGDAGPSGRVACQPEKDARDASGPR
jgi:hypothetical protein